MKADEAATVADVCVALREAIIQMTGCTVSVGAGSNCLLAKLATAAAKPSADASAATPPKKHKTAAAAATAVVQRDGVCVVRGGAANAAAFVGPLRLRAIPGVGPAVASKVAAAASGTAAPKTCWDVQIKGEESLQLLQAALGVYRLSVPGDKQQMQQTPTT